MTEMICNCEDEHEEKFVCDYCFDKANEKIGMFKEGRILFNFELSPGEINRIVNSDYYVDAEFGNLWVGKTIVSVCSEGVYLPKDRKGLIVEVLKRKVVETLLSNKQVSGDIKSHLYNNFTNQAILGEIRFMIGMRRLEEQTGRKL
jgi:hypothetical protein